MPISQNFLWNASREQAAGLVAADVLTDEEIAQRVGITRRTLTNWKMTPEFMERVNAQVAAERAAVANEGIANKKNRVAAQNDRWQKMQRVITERGADPLMAGVPGGTTGLLVRQVKLIRVVGGEDDGPAYQEVDEFAVDTGLLRELREIEKHAAQELGQWVEKSEQQTDMVIREYVGVDPEQV